MKKTLSSKSIGIIGSGLIGLAVARLASRVFPESHVYVIERNKDIGMETSSRNSQVLHAGIYYPPDSLKARLCVKGRAQLIEYAAEKNIAYQQCGKLIVATESKDRIQLAQLYDQARVNQVDQLEWWSERKVQSTEPLLKCQHVRSDERLFLIS